jgi:hypothetical protein
VTEARTRGMGSMFSFEDGAVQQTASLGRAGGEVSELLLDLREHRDVLLDERR